MNWLERLSVWLGDLDERVQRKAQEKHFKNAERALQRAYQEIVAIDSNYDCRVGGMDVRRNLRLALHDVQVFRAEVGLVGYEQLGTEIVRSQRGTAG